MGLTSVGRHPNRSQCRQRKGLTLYEVMLALLILMGALTVLAEHVRVGTRAGITGRLQSQAALLCEMKMGEVIAGIEPLTPVDQFAMPDGDGRWTWSLNLTQGAVPELLNLTVGVTHSDAVGNQDMSFTLHRLHRDPQVFIDATTASATASSSTSSSSSSSTSSNATGGM